MGDDLLEALETGATVEATVVLQGAVDDREFNDQASVYLQLSGEELEDREPE